VKESVPNFPRESSAPSRCLGVLKKLLTPRRSSGKRTWFFCGLRSVKESCATVMKSPRSKVQSQKSQSFRALRVSHRLMSNCPEKFFTGRILRTDSSEEKNGIEFFIGRPVAAVTGVRGTPYGSAADHMPVGRRSPRPPRVPAGTEKFFCGEGVPTGWKPVLPGPGGLCRIPHTSSPTS
jgi:hypothetical protein